MGLKWKQWRRRWKILLGVVLFLIVAYPIVGFFVIPAIARSVAVKQAAKATGRAVAIDKIRLNPYTLTLGVEGFSMREDDGQTVFASVGLLYVDLGWASLFHLAPVVQEVRVEKPYVRVAHHGDGSFNFSTIRARKEPVAASDGEGDGSPNSSTIGATEKAEAKPEPTPTVGPTGKTETKSTPTSDAESKPFQFSVNNIQILGGAADYIDEALGKSHEVRELVFRIPSLSNMGEVAVRSFVEPHFSARFDGKPLGLLGKTKPFAGSRETAMEFGLKGLDLSYYFAYAPQYLGIDLTGGTLDVGVRVSYLQRPGGTADLGVSGNAVVRDLEVRDEAGHPLLRLGALEVDLARSNPLAGDIHMEQEALRVGLKIHVARVALKSPHIGLARNAEGVLNVYGLMGDSATTASVSPSPVEEKPEAVPESGSAMQIALDTFDIDAFDIEDFRVTLQDTEGTSETTDTVAPLFALTSFGIRGVEVDTASCCAKVKSVAVGPARVDIHRLSDGLLNVEALAPPSEKATSEKATSEKATSEGATSGTASAASAEVSGASAVSEPTSENAWEATVGSIGVTSFTVDARSLVAKDRGDVLLELAHLRVADFSNREGAKGRADIELRVNRSGRIRAAGPFGVAPVSAQLGVRVDGMELPWAQPFIDDQLNAQIASGTFGTSLSVTVASVAGEPEPEVAVAGETGIRDFLLRDKKTVEELVRWDALRIGGIDAGNAPLRVEIGTVVLDGFGAFATIRKDGAMNLAQIAATGDAPDAAEGKEAEKKEKPEPTATPTAPPKEETTKSTPEIHIGGVEVRRSRFRFTDRSMSPPYQLSINDVEVRVGAMSNRSKKPTDLSLRAKLQESTDLTISGSIVPLAEELFADVGVRLDGLELNPASTYSGRYAGYEIGSGKLFIDLKYRIEGAALDAENRLVIDQMAFGEKVKSPDAVKLPLRLALAILKDRHGKITVDVPIKGRLDDPEFHFWGTVVRTLVGLVTKAATSPFSALASVVGSDEDLRHAPFEAGSAEIGEGAKGKLDLLAKALFERPGLRLEISGFSDVEADREAIAEARFQRLLKVEKARETTKRGQPTVSPDAVEIAPEERERYLKAAYKASAFEKPKNAIGLLASQPPETMEAMLREHIEVTDGDLEELAKRRAQKAQAYLSEEGKIDSGRLFLVKRTPLAPEAMDGVPGSRVELGVR